MKYIRSLIIACCLLMPCASLQSGQPAVHTHVDQLQAPADHYLSLNGAQSQHVSASAKPCKNTKRCLRKNKQCLGIAGVLLFLGGLV